MSAVPSSVAVAVVLGLFLAACGAAVSPSPDLSSSPGLSPESAAPSIEPSPPPGEPATSPPASESSAPPPSASPEPSPGESPSASAEPSPSGGPAGACTGTVDNRSFFAAAAAAIDWDVYCAVLPGGWYLESGEYHLAGGGRIEITYKGPGGARFELHEGAFCAASDGCVPPGTELGPSAFGDRSGTLVASDAGGYALVVDRGATISWLAVDRGLDEETFRALCAALNLVGG